jgi:hypothetical protein
MRRQDDSLSEFFTLAAAPTGKLLIYQAWNVSCSNLL